MSVELNIIGGWIFNVLPNKDTHVVLYALLDWIRCVQLLPEKLRSAVQPTSVYSEETSLRWSSRKKDCWIQVACKAVARHFFPQRGGGQFKKGGDLAVAKIKAFEV